MPEQESHHYVVGLPVIITVAPNGTVTYEIDTAEATSEMRDCYADGHYEERNDIEFYTDLGHVEADHERRRLAGDWPFMGN
jgi:hypothetical protein